MIDIVFSVGNLAIVCTLFLFLSGSQSCLKIIKSKSVGDISSMPFLTAFINCVIVFLYGVLIKNYQIIIINAIGLNIEIVYIIIFLFYAPNKKKIVHQTIFLMILILTIGFYSFIYEPNSKISSKYVGFMGSISSIIMFGSPLASLKNVMMSKSTESLSFCLCVANLSCSLLWSIYGILLKDKFIYIPNIVGSLLSFAQVSLFAKFPAQSVNTRSKLKTDDSEL
ncbi:Sugar transporter SWEET1 [Brachionus plicatilis]|uniref:Sugar transporter SWEET n=1 Tax=Brachionus plicatilis TaxID=10195 RepID=A0A3M7PW45_BRAPC|nr:Sugar transporter SWEET1 [Brachionus plicatilis]